MEPSAHERSGNIESVVIVCPHRLVQDGSPARVSQNTSLADLVPTYGDDVLALISQGESVILLFVGEEPGVSPGEGLLGDHLSAPGQPLIIVVDDLQSKLVSGFLGSGVRGYIIRLREEPI